MLKINVAKTEYMSKSETLQIIPNREEQKNVDPLKYLGSMIDKNGTIDRQSCVDCMVKLI